MQKQILVIEDSPDLVDVIKIVLRDYNVVSASTAAEAVRELGHDHELIICDLGLPDIDGHELMRYIGSLEGIAPVIVMSGHAEAELAVAARSSRAVAILKKPFCFDTLRKVVAQHCKEVDTVVAA